MSDTDSTASDYPSLGERLARHLENCSECQSTLTKRPKGFGTTTELCSSYQAIIAEWANQEGWVNNIVAHDEYGNEASTTVHETYPEAWKL